MSDMLSRLQTPHFTQEFVDLGTDPQGDHLGVTVRALSRAEVLAQRKEMKGLATEQQARDKALDGDFELWMIATAMVDPVMTVDDVKLWQTASPAGEMEAVTDVIMRLSGLGTTKDPKTGTEDPAEKAAYKSV